MNQNQGQVFKLHSEYKPTGDQPQAIAELVEGFKQGNQFQTLLGVTIYRYRKYYIIAEKASY